MMFIVEAVCQGKSLRKVINRAKAVNIDGSELTFQKVFLHNIIRSIPFTALSALGATGKYWHQAWSKQW